MQDISDRDAALNNCYRLIPKELFNILSDENFSRLKPNMQKEVTAALVNVNAADFISLVHTAETGKIYQIINHVLSVVVPEINNSAGIIDKFIGAGFTAFYPEGSNEIERALTAAILMCEKVGQLGDPHNYYRDFSVGITHGKLILGIVGYEDRLSPMAFSEDTGFTEFLRKKAIGYNAKILITENAIEKIPDFKKKYNTRKLGYFYIDSANEEKLIYDVYDGDSAPMKNIKRKTKLLFEKGIDLYINKNYADARSHFIEVLKANRWDMAAKEYCCYATAI